MKISSGANHILDTRVRKLYFPAWRACLVGFAWMMCESLGENMMDGWELRRGLHGVLRGEEDVDGGIGFCV
jgi:hypothetical protein